MRIRSRLGSIKEQFSSYNVASRSSANSVRGTYQQSDLVQAPLSYGSSMVQRCTFGPYLRDSTPKWKTRRASQSSGNFGCCVGKMQNIFLTQQPISRKLWLLCGQDAKHLAHAATSLHETLAAGWARCKTACSSSSQSPEQGCWIGARSKFPEFAISRAGKFYKWQFPEFAFRRFAISRSTHVK